MPNEPRPWLEDLDACAVACEEAFERLRRESDAIAVDDVERGLLLTAAVARTACGAAGGSGGGFDGEALSNLLLLAAELGERSAAGLAEAQDVRLEVCREACLTAAAAARRLAPRTLSNGF